MHVTVTLWFVLLVFLVGTFIGANFAVGILIVLAATDKTSEQLIEPKIIGDKDGD